MIRDKRIEDFPVYYISKEELEEKKKLSVSLGITLPAYALESLQENRSLNGES